MNRASGNRFDDFFYDDSYVALKNLLYNYLLRKRAIRACLQGRGEGLILEVGSGLSPMVTDSTDVVYTELSFPGLRVLKKSQNKGFFVVADAACLPFKPGSFSQVICSEVLEHLPQDQAALGQMAHVMKTGGTLLLTFPHRRMYFARDDRFVGHYRRYELSEMEERIRGAGLRPVEVRKVLGPLEKIIMALVISAISAIQPLRIGKRGDAVSTGLRQVMLWPFKWLNRCLSLLVWMDARLAPRSLSAVLLIRSVKA